MTHICLFATFISVLAACDNGTSPKRDPELAIENTVSGDGHIHVWLRDKPDNLTLLDSHPSDVEPELLHGRWLIVVYSTLNAHDVRTAIDSAQIARQLNGVAKVAIRPTRAFDKDSTNWIPKYRQIEGIDEMAGIYSPLWLLMANGSVARWDRGKKGIADAVDFAKK